MIHGDYHTKNVMMQNGEVLLIDMDTLCTGHPVFEFASMYLAYCGFGELDHEITRRFLGVSWDTAAIIWKRTLQLYLGTDDESTINALSEKAQVVGYTRLLRRTIRRKNEETEIRQQRIDLCKEHLADLLSRVDSLCFEK